MSFDECTIEEHLEKIHEKLDSIDVALRGNGRVGINTRLDRLEQSEKYRGRLAWIFISAVAVLFASQFYDIFVNVTK